MTHFAELQPILKTLKLSGIADNLQIRNQEAIKAKMNFIDFFNLCFTR